MQVILETASKERQKPKIPACSAMVAGAPSRHVSAAPCCMISSIWRPAIFYTVSEVADEAGCSIAARPAGLQDRINLVEISIANTM
jgi:hypothetical protein